jgi:anti-sigma B factor antagonist
VRPGELTLDHRTEGARHTLVLAGELTLATSAEFAQMFREIDVLGFTELALDLGGLTFMDSTGLREILMCSHSCQRPGRELQITGVQTPVMRLFQLAGVSERLPLRGAQ